MRLAESQLGRRTLDAKKTLVWLSTERGSVASEEHYATPARVQIILIGLSIH